MDERHERLEQLYREHGPAVLAYALRRCAPDLAQDAVAETFLVAWRRLDELPDEPLPWLYGVARKTLANQRRSTRRRRALAERLMIESQAPPAADARILEALAELKPSDRELLMLVAWEGLSPAEAAVALGCSAPACRVRLHRARRRLEQLLDPSPSPAARTPQPKEAR